MTLAGYPQREHPGGNDPFLPCHARRMPASSTTSLGGRPGRLIVHSPVTGGQAMLVRNSATGASRSP